MANDSRGLSVAPGHRAFEMAFAALMVLCAVVLLATPYPWLAFAPPALLFVLAVVGRIPAVAFYLMVFLVPFGAYRKFGSADQTINIPWVLAVLLLVVLLAVDLPRRELIARLRSNLWPLLLLFLGLSTVSTLLSDYPQTSVRNLAYLVAAFAYVSFGMLLIDSRGLRRTLPAVLIASVSLGSLSAVAGYVFKLPFFTIATEGAKTRGTGLATDPNNLALMTIFVLPLVVFFLLRARSPLWRVLMVPLLLVNVAAVGTTFSRGGFAVLIICGIFLLAEHARRLRPRHFGFVALAASVAALLVISLVPANYWARQKSLGRGVAADTAIARRASYLVVGKEAVWAAPLFGAGPGAFQDLYAASPFARMFAKEDSEGFFERFYRRRAHNTYLEVAVGTGIPSLLLFLVLLGRAYGNYSRAAAAFERKNDPWTAGLVRSYRIGFLVVAVYFLIYSDLYHKYLLLALALSQATLTVAADADAGTPPPPPA